MPRYLLTDPAKRDLRDIVQYLRRENPQASTKVRLLMRQAMEKLARNPGIGHYRRDLTNLPVRFYAIYSWLIVYSDDLKPLTILRVIHGARDFPSIFPSKS